MAGLPKQFDLIGIHRSKPMGKNEDEIEGANSVTDYGEHATQILWKSTTELGCALADCTEGVWNYVYLVCQYNPAATASEDADFGGGGRLERQVVGAMNLTR
eukprot:jgi/Undpi1/1622/HiC_scaffold_11.g05012.m1